FRRVLFRSRRRFSEICAAETNVAPNRVALTTRKHPSGPLANSELLGIRVPQPLPCSSGALTLSSQYATRAIGNRGTYILIKTDRGSLHRLQFSLTQPAKDSSELGEGDSRLHPSLE